MSRVAIGVFIALVGVAATLNLAVRSHSPPGFAVGGAVLLVYIAFIIEQLRHARRMKIRSRYAISQREKEAEDRFSDGGVHRKNVGVGN